MSRTITPTRPKIPKYITVLINYDYNDFVKCIPLIEQIEKDNPGYQFVQFGRDVCDGPFAIMRYAPKDTRNLIRG